MNFWMSSLKKKPHGDELGEITVTDKHLLLFLSLDTYAGIG